MLQSCGGKKKRVQSGCSQAALAWIRAASKTAVSFTSCGMWCGGGDRKTACGEELSRGWRAKVQNLCWDQQPLGNRGEQKGEQDALLRAAALVGGRGPASYKGWVQSTKHPRSLAPEVQQSSMILWKSVLPCVRIFERKYSCENGSYRINENNMWIIWFEITTAFQTWVTNWPCLAAAVFPRSIV